MADELKAKGNAAFSSGKYEEAIDFFSQAIAVDASNHVLYSNRSAAFASLNQYDKALEDAEQVVKLNPDWPKGYSRLGAAYHGLRKWEEAMQAYEEGLKLDPDNGQLQQGLQAAEREAARAQRGGGAGGMFGGPDFIAKLAMNRETRGYLTQPDFMAMMSDMQSSPQNMGKYISDPRFLKALEVAMGVRVATQQDMEREAAEQDGEAPGAQPKASASQPEASSSGPEPMQAEPTPEPEPEPEATGEKAAMAAALKEKEAGNAAYKAKRLTEALEHYNKALELAFDLSFLTNRAAVYFEMGEYEQCAKDCDEAVSKGREQRADYKLIGRALARKGNALAKLGRLEEAIEVYNKSLTEHRHADTLKRLNEAERTLKEQRESAYINLDLSNQEKDAGNDMFKQANYPEAIKHYTEALKRGPPAVNPEAYKLFSNRAACYTKLGAMPEALKDANECIRLAPTFSKGYSRKGTVQFFMKDFDKALETYQAGLGHDPDNQEMKDGVRRCLEAIARFNSGDVSEEELQQRQERAMADPEIQTILRDPIMSQVLKDFQENPSAAQAHLKNITIRSKLQKLMAAGIIRMG